MSYWTHIVGIIHVETHIEDDNIVDLVQRALRDAPKITGSECDASIFVNAERGHNISTSSDCKHCDYRGSIIISDEDWIYCDAPYGYSCPTGEYQSQVTISVQGDLRDRMRAQTRKEWNAFHQYIVKQLGYTIHLATCKITGY